MPELPNMNFIFTCSDIWNIQSVLNSKQRADKLDLKQASHFNRTGGKLGVINRRTFEEDE